MANTAESLRVDGELANQVRAHAPQFLLYALVILIGVRGAFLLSDLAGSPAPPPVIGPAPSIPSVSRNVVDVPSLQRANLFGQPPLPQGSADAPVTTLSLVLGGVTAARDPKRGSAMIGTTPADIKFYRVGASVPGGAQLHEVFFDRVLLNRGGSIEALLMPPRAGMPLPPPPPQLATPAAPAAQVNRVQQVMRENPGLLNQIMSRQQVMADNKLRGIRVYPGSNKAAFDKLGLKSGDLVLAINGVQLADQSRPDEVFNSLSSAVEANITVERNGTRQDLHLNLAEVANEAERLAQQGPAAPGAPPGPESAR